MKKMRYIPIVALAALLSSCSLGGMKAPSFAKEGDEVNYEKFFGKLDDAEEKSELSDKDSELGDRILKASDSTSQTTIWKRGKKELEKEVVQSISKGESQFDYSSHVAKMTAEIKGTDKETAQEGTYNITANAKQEQYYQFEKIEGVKYLALVNAKTQQYRGYYPVVEPMKEDDVFDQVVRSTIMNASYYFENYIPFQHVY